MSDRYAVRKIEHLNELTVHVPGSKSITNRALMLAALSSEQCTLDGVLFSDDSRAFLDCLTTLGFLLTIDEANKSVTIQGTGGEIPNKNAIIAPSVPPFPTHEPASIIQPQPIIVPNARARTSFMLRDF